MATFKNGIIDQAAGIDAPSGIQFVPAGVAVGAGKMVVPMFVDTTGTPSSIVIVAFLTTSTISVVEYKRIGNSWVRTLENSAIDSSITLTFTAASPNDLTAFAIDNPAGTADRVLFIATNDASQTPDTFEMNSLVLADTNTSLTAVTCVIAGANQPADSNGMETLSIPLSATRVMTFHEDDAHFADITENAGTYTFTYTDSTVLAVDTSVNVNQSYSGIRIGSQVVLMQSAAPNLGSMWEMNVAAALTEEFNDFHAGLSGSHQDVSSTAYAAICAIGGNFAVAGPVGGGDGVADASAYIITTFPLDDI